MRVFGSVVAVAAALFLPAGCAEAGPTLDGTFKVSLGNLIDDTGKEIPQGAGAFDIVIRSACTGDGCVATAAAPNADSPTAPPAEQAAAELVFDYVDGRWLAVRTFTSTCTTQQGDRQPTDYWNAFVLEPKPDGTLSGEYIARGSLEACAASSRQRVTMIRTGGADPNFILPDPAQQPPRKTTPASGFRGQYRFVSLDVTPNVPPGTPGAPSMTFTAETVCVRTGDRCLTYLLNERGNPKALAFADGKWTETSAPYKGTCQPSGEATKVTRGEFWLPEAPQDPIVEVKGRVTQQALDGPCAGTSEFENTFTRIGD